MDNETDVIDVVPVQESIRSDEIDSLPAIYDQAIPASAKPELHERLEKAQLFTKSFAGLMFWGNIALVAGLILYFMGHLVVRLAVEIRPLFWD